MTIIELIEALKAHPGDPGDLRVVVNGYEQGYDDLSPGQISVRRIALNTGVEDWEGQHGEADHVSVGSETSETTVADALVLRRTSN